MKRAATIVFAAAVGIHCALDAAPPADDEVMSSTDSGGLIPQRPPRRSPRSLEQAAEGSAPARAVPRVFDRQTGVVSRASGENGETYVAGLFSGRTALGDVVLRSRGGDDVFVARVEADGRVAWARSAGSDESESSPEVRFEDGRVRLLATTSGEADCGSGSLNRWNSPMFFICVFDAKDGSLLSAGAYPTGNP